MMLPFFLFLVVVFHLPHHTFEKAAEGTSTSDSTILDREYGPVIFSSMLIRHGERYRAFKYPTDKNAEHYTRKWGQLTKAGKYQMFQVGQWVRERYLHLLENMSYDSDVLQAQSSGLPRCLMTAQLFLAGFFPPRTENELWNEELLWQPISVTSDPKELDKTLRVTKYCSRYNLEVLRVTQTEELRKFYQEYKWLFDLVRDGSELKLVEDDLAIAITETFHMFDNFAIDARYGYPRPAWAESISENVMEEITKMYFQLGTYNQEMKRLKGGNLVKKMVDDMVNRSAKPMSKKRFQLYSAHDSTIAVLLNTLGIFDTPHQAPYGAVVLVELREKLSEDQTKKYYVTILYRKSTQEPPELLEIPDCPNPCSLDDFVAVTKSIIPNNWENECELIEPNYNMILF